MGEEIMGSRKALILATLFALTPALPVSAQEVYVLGSSLGLTGYGSITDGHWRDGLELDGDPAFLVRGGVGEGGLGDLAESDHGLGWHAFIKQDAVALLHGAEVEARGVIAHTGPGGAAVADEIRPCVRFGFGFHQPVLGCHAKGGLVL